MSAGQSVQVDRDVNKLAPAFRRAVLAAIAGCHMRGFDAFVYEAYRSPELQAIYYARGRTIIPPEKPVTYAKSNLYSWHGYCLAVDVISRKRGWFHPLPIASTRPEDLEAERQRANEEGERWFRAVAEEFLAQGCRWGGDWRQRDLPHMQWGRCKPSPSDRARELIRTGGMQAVWEAVGAAA
jgi:peptidoglycan LD-endopeptidase CwlK